MFIDLVLGGLGAIFGAFLRSWLGDYFNKKDQPLPLGTILANALGCFAIGIFTKMTMLSPQANVFLAGGFCGGLTTFSTYSLETVKLVFKRQSRTAVFYWLGSVVLCFACVLLGYVAYGLI